MRLFLVYILPSIVSIYHHRFSLYLFHTTQAEPVSQPTSLSLPAPLHSEGANIITGMEMNSCVACKGLINNLRKINTTEQTHGLSPPSHSDGRRSVSLGLSPLAVQKEVEITTSTNSHWIGNNRRKEGRKAGRET